MQTLALRFLGVEFANPLIMPSGILQEVAAMTRRVIIIHDGKIIGDVTFEDKDNRTERLEAIFAAAVRGEAKPEAVS